MERFRFSSVALLTTACLAAFLQCYPARAGANDISWQSPAQETSVLLETGREAAVFALAFAGVEYRYGGTSPASGMDCSGFVAYVFKEAFDVNLPRTSAEIEQAGMPIEINELLPGDLVFFNTLNKAYSHVGIYLGEHKFIHAPRTGAQIRVENMQLPYWAQRFNGARRIGVS